MENWKYPNFLKIKEGRSTFWYLKSLRYYAAIKNTARVYEQGQGVAWGAQNTEVHVRSGYRHAEMHYLNKD